MKRYPLNHLFPSIIIVFFILNTYSISIAQETVVKTDEELVRAAVEDYVLALYKVEPFRIERSVDTSLHKIGYYDYNNEEYCHSPMTYQQLFDLSATWNKKGDQTTEDSPQKIEIYEVSSKTASAKLTAVWGIDYMHLSKCNGQWKIMSIMWQTHSK